jgi:hypothetical protein
MGVVRNGHMLLRFNFEFPGEVRFATSSARRGREASFRMGYEVVRDRTRRSAP